MNTCGVKTVLWLTAARTIAAADKHLGERQGQGHRQERCAGIDVHQRVEVHVKGFQQCRAQPVASPHEQVPYRHQHGKSKRLAARRRGTHRQVHDRNLSECGTDAVDCLDYLSANVRIVKHIAESHERTGYQGDEEETS